MGYGVEVGISVGGAVLSVGVGTTGVNALGAHSSSAAEMLAVMSGRCCSKPLALTCEMICCARGQYVGSRGPKAAKTEK